jgi:hypothetical protein
MVPQEIIERWQDRKIQWSKLGVQVNGAQVAEEVLQDLSAISDGHEQDLLNLRQAATVSGYSADHLGRLVKDGVLTNYGRLGAPRVRRSELPRKPHPLPNDQEVPRLDRKRIALSVRDSRSGDERNG